MKYLFFSLSIFLINIVNIRAQESNPVKTIKSIKISSGILLEFERSDAYTLDISSDDLSEECLIHTIENGVLTLKFTNIINCDGSVTAKLRCPYIKEIEIMGNAEVSTYNVLQTDTLKIILRSGGKAYLDLNVNYLNVLLTEGSLLTASGYANTQVVNVTTQATFSAFELEGEEVTVQASLGGKGKVCATKKLSALSKIGGYITYTCNPVETEIEKKGNGVVEKLSE